MLPRERIMQNEALILSEFACKAADTRGRELPEAPDDIRTDFQRDRDRIIHCRAFRRLKHKTQFENIGVNPVPLPAKKSICDLPSLFEWL